MFVSMTTDRWPLRAGPHLESQIFNVMDGHMLKWSCDGPLKRPESAFSSHDHMGGASGLKSFIQMYVDRLAQHEHEAAVISKQ